MTVPDLITGHLAVWNGSKERRQQGRKEGASKEESLRALC